MKGSSYNEKVDVFSFAVIIFELLAGRVAMAAIGDKRELDYEAVHAHAEETANGYRLPVPRNWPAAVVSLIQDCWAQRSSKRPSFATIERRIQDIRVIHDSPTCAAMPQRIFFDTTKCDSECTIQLWYSSCAALKVGPLLYFLQSLLPERTV